MRQCSYLEKIPGTFEEIMAINLKQGVITPL